VELIENDGFFQFMPFTGKIRINSLSAGRIKGLPVKESQHKKRLIGRNGPHRRLRYGTRTRMTVEILPMKNGTLFYAFYRKSTS
jgi:hypothetical protein